MCVYMSVCVCKDPVFILYKYIIYTWVSELILSLIRTASGRWMKKNGITGGTVFTVMKLKIIKWQMSVSVQDNKEN